MLDELPGRLEDRESLRWEEEERRVHPQEEDTDDRDQVLEVWLADRRTCQIWAWSPFEL